MLQIGDSPKRKYYDLAEDSKNLLKSTMEKLNLSAIAYDRILKVSCTRVDLSNSKDITSEHIAEAIQYRSLDREGWLN